MMATYVVIAAPPTGEAIVSRAYKRLGFAVRLVRIILDVRPGHYTVTLVEQDEEQSR